MIYIAKCQNIKDKMAVIKQNGDASKFIFMLHRNPQTPNKPPG